MRAIGICLYSLRVLAVQPIPQDYVYVRAFIICVNSLRVLAATANTLKHIFICLYRSKQHILEEIIRKIPKFQNSCNYRIHNLYNINEHVHLIYCRIRPSDNPQHLPTTTKACDSSQCRATKKNFNLGFLPLSIKILDE